MGFQMGGQSEMQIAGDNANDLFKSEHIGKKTDDDAESTGSFMVNANKSENQANVFDDVTSQGS